MFGSERRGKLSREIKRIESKIARRLLIGIHKPRSIESYRGLKTCFIAVEPTIEDQTRGFVNKEARWIETAIEHPKSFSMDRSSYRELSRMQ